MYKINLHTHTKCSDGCNTILEMSDKAYELGHSALVVTDHDYHKGSFRRGERIIKEILPFSKIPIIHGAEITIPWQGECLLFGKEVLYSYFGLNNDTGQIKTPFIELPRIIIPSTKEWIQGMEQILNQGDYAITLCHPYQYNQQCTKLEEKEKQFLSILHGIEIQNNTYEFTKIHWLFQHLNQGVKRLRNSDSHCIEHMENCCNETEEEITTEEQLIKWLRSDIIQ